MEDHQKRVIGEKKELDDKIGKLELFTKTIKFTTLYSMEQESLRCQLAYMGLYSAVLGRRISRF